MQINDFAICVTFLISSDAPLVILPKLSSSDTRPPRATQIMSISCSLEYKLTSSGKYCAKPRDPLERGMIVILSRGFECSRNHPATA